MKRFIPREKLSKKARKALDREKRTTWSVPPTPRIVESKKIYDRKKIARAWKEYPDTGTFVLLSDHIPARSSSFAARL